MLVSMYTETEYSLLSSPNGIDLLVEKAKELGYDALAITDYNNMFGSFKFYNKCRALNIKPIIGLHFDKDGVNLLLYAKSNKGYKNLLRLATIAKMKDMRVDLDLLKEYQEDVVCVIPGIESSIYNLFFSDKRELIKRVKEIKNCFSETYFGVSLLTINAKENSKDIINLLLEYGIFSCEINKCSYINNDYFDSYVYLKSIGNGGALYSYNESDMNLSLLSKLEKDNIYKDYLNEVGRTIDLVRSINVEIGFDGYKTPSFKSDISDKEAYLVDLAKLGLNKRLKSKEVTHSIDLYKERLLYELSVIKKMGFVEYFLIVYDYVKYAKTHDILVGPGRGSAAGSLVAYSLGITDVDPIEYDLLFERFLNPERTSMPDIDTDFPDIKRDEVISYMGERYGKLSVAHICTFDTFGFKSAVRDVARVMNLDNSILQEFLKNLQTKYDTFEEAISSSDILKKMIESYENLEQLCEIVSKIQGLPRNVSVHASGIVMADKELLEYIPLMDGSGDILNTQFASEDIEALGLVKFDFLGIRNLTIIDNVLKKVNKFKGFSLKDIDFNDALTYKLLNDGDTEGLFQLESNGMTQTLKKIGMTSIEDIVASISLYRPGPSDMIDLYASRKNGKSPITYVDPILTEVLKPTYGVIIYQEQILKVAQIYAGYTLGEADVLRRAVSKKKEELIIKERENFISRAVKMGRNESDANKIYDYIAKFSSYGFNKSHAVVYSYVAYYMAYLKAHFYKEFMSELMTNSLGNNQSLKSYISNCERHKIKVYLPSVNYSTDAFELDEEGIYYSLLGIKDLGRVSLNNFLKERNENGLYHTYDEFIARTKSIFSESVIKNLIHAGALDEFNIPRKQMILEYNNSLELSRYGELLKDTLRERSFSDEEYSFEEIMMLEKSALGFNIKYDIFKRYLPMKEKYHICDICDLKVGKYENILFVLNRIKEINTKKNQKMAFISLSDETKEIDGVLFTNEYEKYKDILHFGKIYLGSGKVDLRNGDIQIVIDKLALLGK